MSKRGSSLVVAVAVLMFPASSLAAGTFKTGRYTGTTSQHKPVTFVLTHRAGCTAKTENTVSYCLSTTRQAYVTLTCPDKATANNYLDIEGSLNGSGVLSYTSRGTSEETDRARLQVSRSGTITGYVELKQAESIAGTGPVCSSGKIRFTARHK